jgi:hypothetical protein
MLDKIFNLFKKDVTLDHMGYLLTSAEQLLQHFEGDRLKDGNSRDAAIDAICELLQSRKSTAPK